MIFLCSMFVPSVLLVWEIIMYFLYAALGQGSPFSLLPGAVMKLIMNNLVQFVLDLPIKITVFCHFMQTGFFPKPLLIELVNNSWGTETMMATVNQNIFILLKF